tara:strand:- start:62 stop:2485 length:2424 start_codon:yes stop_codon:yes gene_type:complete
MSLINLSSKTNSRNDILQQQPFNFKNFFPQPIIIEPKSQVCLTSFYHFRTKGFYVVSTNNNVIGYCFGDRQYNNVMYATLQIGMYTGTELVVEIARAMNQVNVQQNYTWTATFTEGNPVANPPTQDVFEMTYDNVDTPVDNGGIWSKLTSRNQNGTLTNNDTASSFSTLVNLSELKLPVILPKGLLVHEGTYTVRGIGYTGVDGAITPCNIGLIRSSMAVDSADMSRATTFNSEFGEILCQFRKDSDMANADNILFISTLQQTAPRIPLFSPNNTGKDNVIRRQFDQAFLAVILPNFTDLLALTITRVAVNRSWVVTCQVSTDGGTTYVDLADDTGGDNIDGQANVYSQTISGVAFSSVIYTTLGLQDGGEVVNPQNGKPLKVVNSASNKKAPFIPFLEMLSKNETPSGLDLNSTTFSLKFPQTGIVADNVFIMEWQTDASGNGYDFGMFEDSGATTPNAGINSTLLENFVIGNFVYDAENEKFKYDVFADNTIAIASATKIADLEFDLAIDNFGLWTMDNIDAGTNITIDPCLFTHNTVAPTVVYTSVPLELNGIFNPNNNPVSLSTGEPLDINQVYSGLHDDVEDEDAELVDVLDDTLLGDALAQQSFLLLSRPNATEISADTGNPVRATNDMRSGTIAPLIGFQNSINVNDNTTFSFTSDTMPFPQIDETSIHISVPELTGVKSYEGESENVAKTIKVIPKNEFTEVSTSNSMTYTAPFEEWIDINNAEPLILNEMTLEVRKPNGEMATSLEPITRATIKIQQDPEIKKLEAQRELINSLSEIRTQAQNTGQIKLMNQQSWVGS